MSKIRYIFITLSVLAVCGYFIWSLGFFVRGKMDGLCEEIRIVVCDSSDLNFVSTDEVRSILKANGLYFEGHDLMDVETYEIEDVIKSHVMVKTAECYKTPSNNVVIELTQRIPKYRVIGNENYYVDTDRNPIPTTSKCAVYVPVVTGFVDHEMAVNELFDFVSYLDDSSFFQSMFTQIYVCENKKIELVPRMGNHVVLLGTLDEDYKNRLAKLKKLYVDGFSEIGWHQYKTIDLQYKGQVVCRK